MLWVVWYFMSYCFYVIILRVIKKVFFFVFEIFMLENYIFKNVNILDKGNIMK